MAWALPDVPGLMEIFLTIAKMLILEELKVLIQWRLSPAEELKSFLFGDSDVVKGDSSGWWIRIDLVIKANKSSSGGGEVCTKSWLVLSVGFCNWHVGFCNQWHSWANRYSPKTV